MKIVSSAKVFCFGAELIGGWLLCTVMIFIEIGDCFAVSFCSTGAFVLIIFPPMLLISAYRCDIEDIELSDKIQ